MRPKWLKPVTNCCYSPSRAEVFEVAGGEIVAGLLRWGQRRKVQARRGVLRGVQGTVLGSTSLWWHQSSGKKYKPGRNPGSRRRTCAGTASHLEPPLGPCHTGPPQHPSTCLHRSAPSSWPLAMPEGHLPDAPPWASWALLMNLQWLPTEFLPKSPKGSLWLEQPGPHPPLQTHGVTLWPRSCLFLTTDHPASCIPGKPHGFCSFAMCLSGSFTRERKSGTHYLAVNPSFSAFWLCDFGKVISTLCLNLLTCEMTSFPSERWED